MLTRLHFRLCIILLLMECLLFTPLACSNVLDEQISPEVLVLVRQRMIKTAEHPKEAARSMCLDEYLKWAEDYPKDSWRAMMNYYSYLRDRESDYTEAIELETVRLEECLACEVIPELENFSPTSEQLLNLCKAPLFKDLIREAYIILHSDFSNTEDLYQVLEGYCWLDILRVAFLLEPYALPGVPYMEWICSSIFSDMHQQNILTAASLAVICIRSSKLVEMCDQYYGKKKRGELHRKVADHFICAESRALLFCHDVFAEKKDIIAGVLATLIIERALSKRGGTPDEWGWLHAICEIAAINNCYQNQYDIEDDEVLIDIEDNTISTSTKERSEYLYTADFFKSEDNVPVRSLDGMLESDEIQYLLISENFDKLVLYLIFILVDAETLQSGFYNINKKSVSVILTTTTRERLLSAAKYLHEDAEKEVGKCLVACWKKNIQKMRCANYMDRELKLSEMLIFINNNRLFEKYPEVIKNVLKDDKANKKTLGLGFSGWWYNKSKRCWRDFFDLCCSIRESAGRYEVLLCIQKHAESLITDTKETNVVALPEGFVAGIESELGDTVTPVVFFKTICDELCKPKFDLKRFLTVIEFIDEDVFKIALKFIPRNIKMRLSSDLQGFIAAREKKAIAGREQFYCPVVNNLPNIPLDRVACYMMASQLDCFKEEALHPKLINALGFNFHEDISASAVSMSRLEKNTNFLCCWTDYRNSRKSWRNFQVLLKDTLCDQHNRAWHKANLQLSEIYQRYCTPVPPLIRGLSKAEDDSAEVKIIKPSEVAMMQYMLRFERGEVLHHELQAVSFEKLESTYTDSFQWVQAGWRCCRENIQKSTFSIDVTVPHSDAETVSLPLRKISRAELLAMVLKLETLDDSEEYVSRALGLQPLYSVKSADQPRTRYGKRVRLLEEWLKRSIDPSWYWFDQRLQGVLGITHQGRLDKLRWQLLTLPRDLDLNGRRFDRKQPNISPSFYDPIQAFLQAADIHDVCREDLDELLTHFTWKNFIECPLWNEQQKSWLRTLKEAQSEQK